MKTRMLWLAVISIVVCLACTFISAGEPVADGLARSSQYRIMETSRTPPAVEWAAEFGAWIATDAEAFVPVRGVATDAEYARKNKELITALAGDIKGAMRRYSPDCLYTVDCAYVDAISESLHTPGLYRIAININTQDSVERLVFDVSPENQTELVRYARMHV